MHTHIPSAGSFSLSVLKDQSIISEAELEWGGYLCLHSVLAFCSYYETGEEKVKGRHMVALLVLTLQ